MPALVRDQELELTIDSLAYGGRGVARHGELVVFVDRALPGDRVRARVTKFKKRYAEAQAVELLEPGPGPRHRPLCPLRRLRWLRVAGPGVRRAAAAQAIAGGRRAAASGTSGGLHARADRAGGLDLGLPQQVRVLLVADRGRAVARLPRGRSLGPADGGRHLPHRLRIVEPAAAGVRDVGAGARPGCLRSARGRRLPASRVRRQLGLVLEAARRRARPPEHVLFAGPPGLGKTTLAMVMANELAVPLRVTSGPAIQHAGDLAAILSSLTEGEVLFLDEIHRMARPAEEMLYLAMEDFRVDVIVGKGPGAIAIPLELPRFTLVGATTRSGLLPGPLRDRFGFTAQLEFYEVAELERVLHRSAALLDVPITPEGAAEIAGRSRGTPRIANRLLRRVRDYAQVEADGIVTREVATRALALYEVDHLGSRPARPGRARRPVPPLRGWSGRRRHAGGRRRRGAGDGGGGRRAVPGPRRAAGPYAARAGSPRRRPGSTSGLAAPRDALGAPPSWLFDPDDAEVSRGDLRRRRLAPVPEPPSGRGGPEEVLGTSADLRRSS